MALSKIPFDKLSRPNPAFIVKGKCKVLLVSIALSTSDFVAKKLQSFGLEVHRGLGGTGVVGILKVALASFAAVTRIAFLAHPLTILLTALAAVIYLWQKWKKIRDNSIYFY